MATSIDRLVRKEVSLGAIREIQQPQEFIGLQIAPFLDVASDDVIFDYIKETSQEGMVPARAEDAESELSQKDDFVQGQGRAAIIDWAQKDKYTASDVTRYREDLLLQQAAQGLSTQLNFNSVGRAIEQFRSRIARDDRSRRRRIDIRLEWLIMSGLFTNQIGYNDGKVQFAVKYGRPTDQQSVAPASGLWDPATNLDDMDPIGDLLAERKRIYDRTGVYPTRGILSQKVVDNLWRSPRFLAAVGMPVLGGTPNVPLDPNYLGLNGYTPEGALRIVEQATKIQFQVYDAVYRSRPFGSTTTTNVRFTDERDILLLPSEADLGEINDTEIGFAKTLTSPHPEGNWTSGYYEWEDESKDPWMHVRGSGIKAFPVFPYLQYTSTLRVLA